jgi:hypothetical protein
MAIPEAMDEEDSEGEVHRGGNPRPQRRSAIECAGEQAPRTTIELHLVNRPAKVFGAAIAAQGHNALAGA